MSRKPTIKELLQTVSILQEENQRLKEGVTRFENLIENMGISMGVNDPAGVLLMMNKSGAANLGGVPQDFIGRRISEFIQGDTDIYVRRIKKAVETGVPEEHEDEVSMPVGRKWFHSTYQPVKDGTDRISGVQINSIDITERKKADESLLESEQKYRTLFDEVPVGIAISTIEGKIIDANKAQAEMIGCTVEELKGRNVNEYYVYPDKRKEMIEVFNKDRKVREFEMQLRRKDGSIITELLNLGEVQIGGKDFIFATGIDITERKRAEAELGRSQQEIRLISDNVPALVSYVDKDGYYRFVNRRYEEWFGIPPSEIIGKHFKELLGEAASGQIGGYVKRGLSGERVSFEEDLPYAHGGRRWVRAEYVPDVDSGGKVKGYFGLVTDITERKRVEEALRESEARFSTIFRASPASIAIARLKDGEITDVNPAWEKVTGLTREEAIGHASTELNIFLNPGVRNLVITKLHQQGTVHNLEFQLRHKSGSISAMLLSAELIELAGELYVLTIAHDITSRKRVEEALRESEEVFSRFMERSPIYIFFKDDQIRSIRLSANYEKMLGKPLKDLLGKTMDDLFPSDLAKRMIADDLRILWEEKEIVVEEELNGRHYSTIKFPIHIDGKPRYLAGYTIDITERKQAEEALRESEEHYRSVVEGSNDGIGISCENKRVYVNKKFLEIFGYTSPDEVLGKQTSLIVHPDDLERYAMMGRRRERGEMPPSRYEFKALRKGGEVVHVEAAVSRIVYGGKPCSLTFVRDISARKKIEQELRETQVRLFQAQKMESLGILVAGVAHEINNPLNLIMFNVPLLQKVWRDLQPVLEEKASNEPHRKYGGLTYDFLKDNLLSLLSDMNMASNRIAKIVTGLKDFARESDVTDKAPMQLNSAVENAVRLFQATLKKSGIEAEVQLAPNLPLMEGNIQSIEQIMLNLLMNASQAIDHDHGKIKVITGFQKATRRVFVSVSDNGRGIDRSVAERIFDPFVTTRQTEGGTGLGLSISCGLAKAHNGDITFKSHKQGGSTFTAAFSAEKPMRAAKILIVDDDEMIREVLRETLTERRPCVVESAGTGIEAMIRIGRNRPDLLILDIFMPDMDGVEVCRVLKNDPELSGVKVIIITGFPDHPQVEGIRVLGYDCILLKPLDVGRFMEEVERVLKG